MIIEIELKYTDGDMVENKFEIKVDSTKNPWCPASNRDEIHYYQLSEFEEDIIRAWFLNAYEMKVFKEQYKQEFENHNHDHSHNENDGSYGYSNSISWSDYNKALQCLNVSEKEKIIKETIEKGNKIFKSVKFEFIEKPIVVEIKKKDKGKK